MKILTNQIEYEDALDRIDELWNAEAGTPEGDELLRLINMVEKYDNYYPLWSVKAV